MSPKHPEGLFVCLSEALLLPFSRQDELTGFKSWLHCHPPHRPHHPHRYTAPLTALILTPICAQTPSAPAALSALPTHFTSSPPSPLPHCPHRSPPSLLGHCPHLAALGAGLCHCFHLAALGAGLCHCPHLAALGSGLEGANRSTETREFQQKEQTARKELENFRTRSKPLERD